MSSQECPVEDRRINTCPIAEKIADDAAEKAIGGLLKKFGYDIEDKGDLKKMMTLLNFLETASNNVSRGKVAVMITLLGISVTGITGAVVAKLLAKN